jgi:hypothetical protein
MNVANRCLSRGAVFVDVHLLLEWHGANQVMPRFRERRLIRFGREQVEAAINLKRIRADDFGTELPRDLSGDVRFSNRRRSNNEEDARH